MPKYLFVVRNIKPQIKVMEIYTILFILFLSFLFNFHTILPIQNLLI